MPSDYALTDDEALEMLAYLVASARTCAEEPPDYGSLRLISAAERIARLWRVRCSEEICGLLEELIARIPREAAQRQADPAAFVGFLGDCCKRVASEIKRRYQDGEVGRHD